jgi:CPA1 family monovalent cation:H+ antiporter
MSVLGLVELVVVLLALSGAVALVSLRLRVPYTLALVIAGVLIGVAGLLPGVGVNPDLILFLFLPALLFEGAWSLDLRALANDWLPIFLLAVPGLLLTVAVVAVVLHLGLALPWLFALLLGAVLSPTDPVAALALFRQLRMPERLRTVLEGESLFNDGAGAAVFEIVLGLLLAALGLPARAFGLVAGNGWLLTAEVLWLIFGGLALGLGVAWLASRLLTLVDNFLFETTLTFTVAYGVYLLAVLLHASGILAVIAAGLLLGSIGRRAGMSPRTSEAAGDIWQFTGYLANSFLFLLLGLEMSGSNLRPALPAIGWAVLGVVVGRAAMLLPALWGHDALARWLATPEADNERAKLGAAERPALRAPEDMVRRSPRQPRRSRVTARLHRRFRGALVPVPRVWRPILLFSGLRGALSIALVLSLPEALPQRPQLEVIVYGVVLVTLVGQGLLLRVALPHWPAAKVETSPQPPATEGAPPQPSN